MVARPNLISAMPSTPPPQAPSQSLSSGSPSPPAPPDPGGRRPDEPPWPVWTAPAAIALGFGLGIFVSIIVAVVSQAGGSSLSHPTPAVSLISDFLFDVAFVAAALYFAGARGRPRPSDFGFRRVRLRTAVGALLGAGVGYYVVTALYASAVNIHGRDKLPSELGVSTSTAALVGATVFVCVVAPIAEEFFFRGFIFGALRQLRIVIAGHELGPWVAAVLTGILFGLAHTGSASSQYLIPLGFLGFVLCLIRWKTGSLYPCMALHSINNALALGISQLHWNAIEILGLVAGSMIVIAALTGPLAQRAPAVP
jgi:membrane protease YdiL (CAAX protease family)